MTKEQLFPFIVIGINAIAGLIYLLHGDFRRGLYFLFAAGLNICVTV